MAGFVLFQNPDGTERDSQVCSRLSLDELISEVKHEAPGLLLRQMSADGQFFETQTCKPGEITVLDHAEGDCVRDSLLGHSISSSLDLRYGDKPLHPSEVRVVGVSPFVWKENTTFNALRSAGAPQHAIEPLLAAANIDPDTSPFSLDEGSLRRFSICCSMFSPAKVLLFDRPFKPLDESWVEDLGAFMLEAVEVRRKIILVTNLERMPKEWERSEKVVHLTVGDSISLNKPAEIIEDARKMLAQNRVVLGKRKTIVTRPQTIHDTPDNSITKDPRAASDETISNPEFKVKTLFHTIAANTKKIDQPKGLFADMSPVVKRTLIAYAIVVGVVIFFLI